MARLATFGSQRASLLSQIDTLMFSGVGFLTRNGSFGHFWFAVRASPRLGFAWLGLVCLWFGLAGFWFWFGLAWFGLVKFGLDSFGLVGFGLARAGGVQRQLKNLGFRV